VIPNFAGTRVAVVQILLRGGERIVKWKGRRSYLDPELKDTLLGG
jgi:hypothetical protein